MRTRKRVLLDTKTSVNEYARRYDRQQHNYFSKYLLNYQFYLKTFRPRYKTNIANKTLITAMTISNTNVMVMFTAPTK